MNVLSPAAITIALSACVGVHTPGQETPQARTDSTPSQSTGASAWKEFEDEEYRISLRYPPQGHLVIQNEGNPHLRFIDVMGEALGSTDFALRLVWYPQDPFFNPPPNIDITRWVTLQNAPDPYDKIVGVRLISGLPALHVVAFPATTYTLLQHDMYYLQFAGRVIEITAYGHDNQKAADIEDRILDSIRVR